MKGRGPVTRKAGRAEIFRKGLRIRGLEESGTILNAEFKARKLSSWSANHSIIQVTWVRGSEIPRGSRLNRFPVSGSFRSVPFAPGAIAREVRLNRFFVSESFRSLTIQSVPSPANGGLNRFFVSESFRSDKRRGTAGTHHSGLNRFFVSESFRSSKWILSCAMSLESQSLLRQRLFRSENAITLRS